MNNYAKTQGGGSGGRCGSDGNFCYVDICKFQTVRLLKQTVKCDIFPFLGTRDAEHLLAMMSLNPGNTLVVV